MIKNQHNTSVNDLSRNPQSGQLGQSQISQNCNLLGKRFKCFACNMLRFGYIFALLICNSVYTFGQKVYSVDHDYQADIKVFVVDKDYRADLIVYKTDKSHRAKGSENKGIWYFTPIQSQADKKIFFVDKESRADLKVFFTDIEYRAGWRKNDKKHLMY